MKTILAYIIFGIFALIPVLILTFIYVYCSFLHFVSKEWATRTIDIIKRNLEYKKPS